MASSALLCQVHSLGAGMVHVALGVVWCVALAGGVVYEVGVRYVAYWGADVLVRAPAEECSIPHATTMQSPALPCCLEPRQGLLDVHKGIHLQGAAQFSGQRRSSASLPTERRQFRRRRPAP